MGWSRSSCEIWGQMVVFQCPKMTINDMTVENSCVCHGTPPGGAGSYPQCLRNVQQQASGVLHVQNPECLLLKGFFSPLLQPLSLFYRSPQKQQEDLSFPYRGQQSTAVQSQQVFPPHRHQTSAPAVVEGSGIMRCT